MTAAEEHAIAEVKSRFSEILDRIRRTHGRVIVTRHGQPAAVIMSVEDLRSLEETLEVLSDPKLLADIREGRREAKSGKARSLTKDAAVKVVRRR